MSQEEKHRRDGGKTAQSVVSAAGFDQFSGTYQNILDGSLRTSGEGGEYFAELKARYLAQFLGSNFSGKVLDFGCGIGLLSRFLLSYLPSCELYGYDVSCASLELIPPDLSARGKFTSLENELRSDYDLIIAANVMHHIPREKRWSTVMQLQKRLRMGGKLAAFEHNPLNPLTRLTVKQCPFDVGFVLLWPRELLTYLKGAGLILRRCDYIAFFPYWLRWLRQFERKLSWCPFGAQFAAVGEKSLEI